MRKIKLTRGKFAIVDDEDFEYLNQYKWYCSFYGYAVRDEGGRKNKKAIPMHRFLNGTPSGLVTDHINRNKLDNRKVNLRSVTGSQNCTNRGLNKNNVSGHKGVIWRKDIRRWSARIKTNYKEIYLGCFINIKDAIKARKKAELIYHVI
jgi:hypothetical protein